jgi:hypothetical protein
VLRLKTVASIDPALDTRQANARSMASSKGWRLDGVITPYVRICVRVMRALCACQNRRRKAKRRFLFLQWSRPTVFLRKRLKLLTKNFGFPPNLHAV